MSNTTLHTFLLWAPDYTDADALNRRLAVRPKHFENARPLTKSGVMSTYEYHPTPSPRRMSGSYLTTTELGGALIDPPTYNTSERKMIGSMIIYEAESMEAVRKIVEEDIYYTGGVVSTMQLTRGLLIPTAIDSGIRRSS